MYQSCQELSYKGEVWHHKHHHPATLYLSLDVSLAGALTWSGAYDKYYHVDEYLEKAWPTNGLKAGYGALRAVEYDKIAASLRDRNVCTEVKNWATKREFFLLNAAEGAGSALAIPASKGRVLPNHPLPGSYKLVARLEDFATIIAKYHNDTTGHPGIRKTYSRVSVLCMRMQ